MLPPHRDYRSYDLAVPEGKVTDLDHVYPLVVAVHPDAHMHGSAGLVRMFLNGRNEFVAYAWGVKRGNYIHWRYLIFSRGYDW